jgi:hypothetical protein
MSPTLGKKTFEKKEVLTIGESSAVDDGAPDLMEKEEAELGQGPIKHGTGDDCRCLWLCPGPLMKMLRGHNALNPVVGTPLPKPT